MAYHGNVHGNVHGNDGNVQNDSLHKAFQRSCMFPPTCNCSSRMLNSSCSSSSCRNPIASGADLILQHYIAKSHEFNQALKVGEKDPQSLIEMLEPILQLQEQCMMLLHSAQQQTLMQNKILMQQHLDSLGRMGIDRKIEGAQAWIMNTSGNSDESDIEKGKPKTPGKALENAGAPVKSSMGESGTKSEPASGSGPLPLSKALHHRMGRAKPRLRRSYSIGRCENLEKNKLVDRL
eukprot:TRINITY_DN24576_c0_g1_i2.p1 TRINITY_DN24576_c0_g1~~TRINITY_DN24576_c0_g1_i2.p1  ORF type:complete len:235 (+),score=30.63 TRINITY_DN24576_c0_g1_i2:72-776(+)